MQAPAIQLSLGPILYYWHKETIFDFYQKIAKSAINIVYLGETVCSKRRLMRDHDWLEIAALLTAAGKQVVISTLTLIEASSELSKLKKLCANKNYMIEANDMAAVSLLSGKYEFVTGPCVNIYNSGTLKFLANLGLKRWVLPIELSKQTLSDFQSELPDKIETEIFFYGRLPLAFSARCFTARAHNLAKDDCQYRCLDDPDGLLLSTREDDPFLILNGIQTQSAKTCNLISDLDEIKKMNVDILRISPQSKFTLDIINIIHDCLHDKKTTQTASDEIENLTPTGSCNGYWYGGAGMESLDSHLHKNKAGRL